MVEATMLLVKQDFHVMAFRKAGDRGLDLSPSPGSMDFSSFTCVTSHAPLQLMSYGIFEPKGSTTVGLPE